MISFEEIKKLLVSLVFILTQRQPHPFRSGCGSLFDGLTAAAESVAVSVTVVARGTRTLAHPDGLLFSSRRCSFRHSDLFGCGGGHRHRVLARGLGSGGRLLAGRTPDAKAQQGNQDLFHIMGFRPRRSKAHDTNQKTKGRWVVSLNPFKVHAVQPTFVSLSNLGKRQTVSLRFSVIDWKIGLKKGRILTSNPTL